MKPTLITLLLLLTLVPSARAQYTFTVAQSSGSGVTTYNSGANTFQYTDATTPNDDNYLLGLGGTSASLITLNNNWSATVTVSLGATTMTKPNNESPQIGFALGIVASANGHSYIDTIHLTQDNSTGNTGNSDVPSNFYGTLAEFEADTDGNPVTTTTLGTASNYAGTSYVVVAGSTNTTQTTEAIAAATGFLGLSYNASTKTLTGSYNGSSIGSISLSNLGSSPILQLGVGGFSGEGIGVTSGQDVASSFGVVPEPSIAWLLLAGLGGLAAYRRFSPNRS